MRELANRVVHSKRFDYFLIVLLIATAILQGLGTSETLFEHMLMQYLFASFWILALMVLVLEAILKMFALSPRIDRYFKDGWNVFDFLGISFLIFSLVFLEGVHFYGIFVYAIRLLRLLRGLSAIQGLRFVLATLFRSLPSVGHIVLLLCIVLYVYALVGYGQFADHDPARWGSVGNALLTLFEMATLDGWSEVMRPIIELEPLASVYFVSFVIITAYIVTNIFIAVVINSLDEVLDSAREERRRPSQAPASREDVLQELRLTQQALYHLEQRVQAAPDQ